MKKKILITNDDGIGALGLIVLKKYIERIGDVWMIAPEENKSGCGNGMTFDRSLTLRKIDDKTFTVNGTPADCVNVALHVQHEFPVFDMVVSGINQGENIGLDIHYSGTIAAARQAVIHDKMGIALSAGFIQENEGILDSISQWFCSWLVTHSNTLKRDLIYNLNFPEKKLELEEEPTYTQLGEIQYKDEYEILAKEGSGISERLEMRIKSEKFLNSNPDKKPTDPPSDKLTIEQMGISITLVPVLGVPQINRNNVNLESR